MSFNLNNRHLLSLTNHTEKEIRFLLDLARDLKRAKYAGTEQQTLRGKNIALIFEKTSTRTRCAFEVAAYDQARKRNLHRPNLITNRPQRKHERHRTRVRSHVRRNRISRLQTIRG